MARIFLNLTTASFFAFASALVIQFQSIQTRIRSVSSSDSNTVVLLEKLNGHLFMTCGAISELANYFSIIFLLFVSCIFVQTITFSHLIFRMISGQESRNMYSTIITFFDVFRMVFILHTICYKTDELKDEVCTFHK